MVNGWKKMVGRFTLRNSGQRLRLEFVYCVTLTTHCPFYKHALFIQGMARYRVSLQKMYELKGRQNICMKEKSILK